MDASATVAGFLLAAPAYWLVSRLSLFVVGAAPSRWRSLSAAHGLALVALAVRLTSRGPAFFVQTRIGQYGARFGMVKFRSIDADAEQRRAALVASSDRNGLCFKMKNDPRVTPLGRFLRRTSLDELPQLFNVLWGDMSLVGPRPALPQEVAA